MNPGLSGPRDNYFLFLNLKEVWGQSSFRQRGPSVPTEYCIHLSRFTPENCVQGRARPGPLDCHSLIPWTVAGEDGWRGPRGFLCQSASWRHQVTLIQWVIAFFAMRESRCFLWWVVRCGPLAWIQSILPFYLHLSHHRMGQDTSWEDSGCMAHVGLQGVLLPGESFPDPVGCGDMWRARLCAEGPPGGKCEGPHDLLGLLWCTWKESYVREATLPLKLG